MQKNLPDKTSIRSHLHKVSPRSKFPYPKLRAKIKTNIVSSSRSFTICAILAGINFSQKWNWWDTPVLKTSWVGILDSRRQHPNTRLLTPTHNNSEHLSQKSIPASGHNLVFELKLSSLTNKYSILQVLKVNVNISICTVQRKNLPSSPTKLYSAGLCPTAVFNAENENTITISSGYHFQFPFPKCFRKTKSTKFTLEGCSSEDLE